MRRISLALALALFCGGCTYSPRYTPAPSTDSSLEPLHLAVAVPLVGVGGPRYLGDKMDAQGTTEALVQDMAAAKLFQRQELVAARYRSCDAACLEDLRSQGYDAVLVVTVNRLTASPEVGITGEILVKGGVIGALAAPVVGLVALGTVVFVYSAPMEWAGSMGIDYRLVDAASGSALSFGPGNGSARMKKAHGQEARDAIVKDTFARLIQDIRNSQLPDTPGTASPIPPR